MKISINKMGRWLLPGVFAVLAGSMIVLGISSSTANARVIDNNPVTDQRWIISEIYLGDDDYDGAYVELYNNDDHTSLGWKDFVINLPFDVDLPPIYDLHTYKPHAYKKLSLDEGIMGWLAKKYIQIMYGDDVFYEIEDALQEQDGYSYQRCQTTYDDGTTVLSNKFYYGKKTPGKAIECDDKSVTVTNPDDAMTGTCEKLKLNEIGSYMEPEEQFIELVNSGNEPINLSNCYVAKSKAKNAVHAQMDDYELEPGGLYAFNVDQTDLEYIAKTSGIIYLIDSDDETVVNYKRYSGVKEGASTAINNNGEWQMTYQMTPGEDNIIEEYPPCPEGQYRDDQTHRCRNIPEEDTDNDNDTDNDADSDNTDTTDNGLKPCKEGYYRNPETNRCKKIPTDEEDELKPCPDGYYRNPETNRCKKIDDGESDLVPCREGYVRNPATNRCVKIKDDGDTLSPCPDGYYRNPETNRCKKIDNGESDLKPCKEGYERNPATNRCVKIKNDGDSDDANDDSDDDSAKYPVAISDDNASSDSTTSLLITLGIIITLSVGILVWQYRKELGRWWHQLCNRTKADKAAKATQAKQQADTHQQLTDHSATDESTDDWMDKLTK